MANLYSTSNAERWQITSQCEFNSVIATSYQVLLVLLIALRVGR